MSLAPAKTKASLLVPSRSNTADESKDFDPDAKLRWIHLDSCLSFAHHHALTRKAATLHLRLVRYAITQLSPSVLTLRTFDKALIESRLFYGAAGWGPATSDYELSLLETAQRHLARAVTGVLSQAPPWSYPP